MQFTVDRKPFLSELALLQGIVGDMRSVPICSNVLIKTEMGKLVMTATDLENSMVVECGANIESFGGTAVLGKKLFEYIRACTDDKVKWKATAKQVALACGKATARITCMEADKFPELDMAAEHVCDISPATFDKMINRVIFAISNQESRYVLQAAMLEVGEDSLRMIATDGHRLSLVEIPSGAPQQRSKMIIPKPALAELQKIIAKSESSAILKLSENSRDILFEIGSRQLLCRKMTGQFPAYEKVLPGESENHATMKRKDLLSALRRCGLFTDDRTKAMRMEACEIGVKLLSNSADSGEDFEEVPATVVGKMPGIGFNAVYLTDFVLATDSEEVTMHLRDDQSSAEFRPGPEGAIEFRHVIMPMRL